MSLLMLLPHTSMDLVLYHVVLSYHLVAVLVAHVHLLHVDGSTQGLFDLLL